MSNDDLRRRAIESLLNEAGKRKTLSETMGAEAYYTNRYAPAKADTGFVNRQLRRVESHNKRWEMEKCWTIKKNLDKLDSERRKHPKKVADKYKDEKEYWRVEKALKFATKSDREVIDELNVDRNNMLL
ncbi:hypothetical protein WA577_002880, partial [Blastocystis sp. JDR]